MNGTSKLKALFLVPLVFLSLVCTSALAQSDPDAYGDEYASGDFARVMYGEGDLKVRRAVGDRAVPLEEAIEINGPVFPGDTLLSHADSRGEVQLAGGTLVRFDVNTELTFLALPSTGATIQDNTVLQLAGGTIRIAAIAPGKEEFRIDTPIASVYLLGEGDFRIEVDPDGSTRLSSRRGVAELAGQSGSVLVRGGMLARATPGSVPSTPRAYNTFTTDGFDRWVALRDEFYREQDRHAGSYDDTVYEELPVEVRPYYRELSTQGAWVHTEDYGYVWYPANTPEDWRPYSDGYWTYGPSGYFWVGGEPWGWAPYHYGRWSWVVGSGWCWIPGRVFAGAWVAWSWGSAYIGWGPLDYWNRPVYYGPLHYGYYDYNCWTFVHYSHLYHHGYHHYKARPDHVGHYLSGNAVVTRPPRVSPTRMAGSREAVDEAMRTARTDTRGRVSPLEGSDRPSTTMVDLENRWSRVGSDRASRVRPSSAGNLGRPSGRPTDWNAATRRSDVLRTGSSRGSATRQPRTTEGRNDASLGADQPRATRRLTAGPTAPSRTSSSNRPSRDAGARRPAATPRRSVEPRGSSQRVRTLYREMAQPRTTRPEGSNSSATRRSRTSTPSRGAKPTDRSTAAPSKGGTTSRPSAGRSGSSSRSTGARSRPKSAGGSSRSTGARSKPKSGGSSSRSTGARSRPKSGGSSSRSSGVRSRPSSGRSSPSSTSRGSTSRSSRGSGKKN